MKRKTISVLLIVCMTIGINSSFAQNIGINSTGFTPNAAAILDLNTGNAGTQGLLPEQVSLTAANAAGPITSPPTGLIVYNLATAGSSPNNVAPGYYFNAGTPATPNWVSFIAGNSATTTIGGWLLDGNTGTNPATNFIGTTDANALNFRTNNTQRMTILSTGQVGVGTSTPSTSSMVEVDQNYNGGSIGMIHLSSIGKEAGLSFIEKGNGSQSYSIKCGDAGAPAKYLAFHDETAGGNPARMVIMNGTGNVGIGTTAPAQLLDVEGGSLQFSNALMPAGNAGTLGQLLVSQAAGAAPQWTNVSNAISSTAWLLNGNTGTTPATNFVGTIDANALNFRTTNTQRMTILSGGNVGINTAAPGSILEVDGATASQVVNFQNTNAAGVALQGINTAASGTANGIGVLGISSQGYAAGPVSGYGVAALNNNASGLAIGTGLYAAANDLGLNFITVTNGCGAILVGAYGGFGFSPYNGGYGMWGYSTGTQSLGVYGQVIGTSAVGAFGQATGTTSTGVLGVGDNATVTTLATGSGGAFDGTAVGSYGLATTVATGIGVVGAGNNVSTYSSTTGGSGGAFTGTTIGAYGFANTVAIGTGVLGVGNDINSYSNYASGSGGSFTGLNVGAYGVGTTVASGTGVIGAGNNTASTVLAAGSGGAFTGATYGVYANATGGANPSAAIYADNAVTGSSVYVNYYNGTNYKIYQSTAGTVSCSVLDTKGNNVVMHAPETPEAYFEDYGQGQLINGKVHIDMDPTYAKNICVNEKHPLRVYVQLEGDCKGVYVTNKTTAGFDVVELNGGNSNVSFQYHIIGNMADAVMPSGVVSKFADLRFEPAPKPEQIITTPLNLTPVQQNATVQMHIATSQVKTSAKPLDLPVQNSSNGSVQAIPTNK